MYIFYLIKSNFLHLCIDDFTVVRFCNIFIYTYIHVDNFGILKREYYFLLLYSAVRDSTTSLI